MSIDARDSASGGVTVDLRPPDAVVEIVDTLLRAAPSHRVWAVGGTVRDALLGDASPRDWDLVTDAPPATWLGAFAARARIDAELGVAAFDGSDGIRIDLAALREEGGYTAVSGRVGRRPARVRFVAEPARDARRRDFTFNALYANWRGGAVLDPLELRGVADLLERRLVRVVGDPAERFLEDPLRILRGCRFVALLGAAWDPDAEQAVREHVDAVRRLSGVRVGTEFDAAMARSTRGAVAFVDELERSGLRTLVLPEAEDWPRGRTNLAELPAGVDAGVRWAALLGARVEDAGRRFGWSRGRRLAIGRLARAGESSPADGAQIHAPPERVAVLREALRRAAGTDPGDDLAAYRAAVAAAAVRTDDLFALGVPRGAAVGRVRRAFVAAAAARRESDPAALRDLLATVVAADCGS